MEGNAHSCKEHASRSRLILSRMAASNAYSDRGMSPVTFLMLYSGLEKWQNKKAEKTCQKLCEIINHLFGSCVYTDVRTERAEMSISPVDCPMKSEANRKPAESRSIVNER